MSFLIVFLCGMVSALPFLAPSLWFLGWVSLSPLFMLARKGNKPYLHGLVYGYGFYLVLFYWFAVLYPMDFMGMTPKQSIGLIAICWVGLSTLQAAEIALVPLVYARLRSEKRRWTIPLAAAFCYTVFEWAQTLGWSGVPWGRLAVGQTGCLAAIQSASLGGSLFVGFLMGLVNGLFAVLIKEVWEWGWNGFVRRARCMVPLALAIALFASNLIFGAFRLRSLRETVLQEAQPVKVGCIQGCISSVEKWADDSVGYAMMTYRDLSEKAIGEGASILVWPETVITVSVRTSPERRAALSDFAKEHEITLILGTFDTGYIEGTDDPQTYNSLILFHPDGSMEEEVYHKRHLVPFGEYLPMRWLFSHVPFLSDLNLVENDLTPGEDASLFETEYGKIGGLVCFDSIYDTLSRDSVSEGAQLLVLGTNDSWYRDSRAIYQHNSQAVLRAVENGRYMARAANTGISTVITPWGEVTQQLEPLRSGYIVGQVRFLNETTPYNVVGNLIAYLSLAGIAVVFALARTEKKKH